MSDVCRTEDEVLERMESCLLRHLLPGFSPGSPLHREFEPFIDWLVEEKVLRKDGGVYLFDGTRFLSVRRRSA